MSVTQSSMEALGALVSKAVNRADLMAKARERLSIVTTVEEPDSVAVKARIVADVLTHQVRAS